ncbi:hypothetical protein [Aquitalea sp. LB_tupeE]|uniref:DUF2515 family protein n=1 Tax=Aquitalea sp. LB_tupeE TaxID=2748078 RepID=UPI0015BDA92D|nr:hypothetical protein [Aquitalea sp. LB_tupeE]NWK78164.1 hypothetical protein [Aquitalea sp. LB_tupeE]
MSQPNPLTTRQIMSTDNLSATSMLNSKPNSVCYLEGTCQTAWSLAQQFAIVRLSPSTPPDRPPPLFRIRIKPISPTTYRPIKGDVKSKSVRARIVAATYARFYLETEEFSDPKRKGRYYWMALGAFASKNVACTLEHRAVKAATGVGIDTVADGLGKGNFWLFQDIAPIHWLHSYDYSAYFHCANTRGEKLHEVMENQLTQLPWAEQALPVLQHLKLSSYAQKGMLLVREIEKLKPGSDTYREKQLAHLLAIANHEQRVVLQKLIYDDPAFAVWLKRQRTLQQTADTLLEPSTTWPPQYVDETSQALALLTKAVLPPLELVFAAACKTRDPKLKSVAPKDTVLENENSRMRWIGLAAKQFHGLMETQAEYMDQQLRSIASWHTPDMTTFELVLRQHDPWYMR